MARHRRRIPLVYARTYGGPSRGEGAPSPTLKNPIVAPVGPLYKDPPQETEADRDQRADEERLITDAERVVAQRRRDQQLAWARSVLATEGQATGNAPTADAVRAELAQD